MTEPRVLARFTSYGDLMDALRERIDELGIPHTTFDEICGIAEGLTNKVLQPVNPPKYLGPKIFGSFIETAGCELWLVARPDLEAKIRARSNFIPFAWPKKRRDFEREVVSQAQIKRLRPYFFKITGQMGGLATAASRTPAQRSESARRAAHARHRKSRKLRKLRGKPNGHDKPEAGAQGAAATEAGTEG